MIIELISQHLRAITASLAVALLCKQLIEDYFSWRNLPKGPFGLPFVGYLPFLGPKPHLTIDNLRKKYGDIFT